MLKYLFEAHFKDGSLIQQAQDDQSIIEPTKSRFYDVVQREDDLFAFGIFSNETHFTYAVDLRDGHFEVNNAPFYPAEVFKLEPDSKLRLIYFRQRRHHFHFGEDTPFSQETTFHIGWQTTLKDGSNLQYVIAVQ